MLTLERARAWYTEPDTAHGFDHIERVYSLARHLALEEKADLEIVLAAAFLHDARGSTSGGEGRNDHHIRSAEFAVEILSAEGWEPERIAAVQHCIRAHRFRSRGEAPETLEARVLFDADKLDVLGAIGVARTVAYAALAGQPIYIEPSISFKETGEKEEGEPHSSYHEYLFKLSRIKDGLYTATGRAMAVERHEYMEIYFQVLGAEIRGER